MNGNNNEFNYNPFDENNDYDYLYQTVTRRGRKKTYGWSVAAMVCGIVSAASFLSGFSAIILGVLAVVFSLISRKNLGYFDGKAVSGLILGIIGFCFALSFILLINFNESIADWFFDFLYNGSGIPVDDSLPSSNPQSPSV
ncbi:MAG: DUF4190 domain-containing protein [Clostridia bacterium]|nr:DUF4190 domain-containing protein [Clostridia bacterium]